MKDYMPPTCERFLLQTVDTVLASGDGIVASNDKIGAAQTIETEWKDSWN